MLTKNIMLNIMKNHRRLEANAFTLLESLLVLFIAGTVTILVASSVQGSFQATSETLFFEEFEQFYKDSQSLAVASQEELVFDIKDGMLSNGYQQIEIPAGITPAKSYQLALQATDGGNSSLQAIEFQTAQHKVRYQFYLGSGRYQKTVE